MSTTSVGQAAEQAVAEELTRRGYIIVDQNWKTKWCEIDIIAKHGDVLWFIEVKYRKTTAFGDGLDYIGPQKVWHMQRAADLWVARHGYAGEYTLAAASVTGDYVVDDLIELVGV